MDSEEKRKTIWFPAKRYGVGWGLPNTWQGWAVLLAYFVLMAAGTSILLKSPKGAVWLLPYVFSLTLLLIVICWKKGEKLQWRWGDKR